MARKITIRTRGRIERRVRAQGRVQRSLQVQRIPHQPPVRPSKVLTRTALVISDLIDEGFGPLERDGQEFDLFLSYASENGDFAAELAYCLESQGVRVWFDETAIAVGDSLRQSIDDGLRYSRFGVVVFSKWFFEKNWTNYELDGLITREMQGKKVVLPVLHPDFTLEAFGAHSPSLAGRKALLGAEHTIEELAEHLAELVLR